MARTSFVPESATHMFVPSNARAAGAAPSARLTVASSAPVATLTFMTLFEPWFATQMFVPSNATATGSVPTGYGPNTEPVVTLTFETVPLAEFATHTFVPSNASALGVVPTVSLADAASPRYQWSVATCLAFRPPVTTPDAPAPDPFTVSAMAATRSVSAAGSRRRRAATTKDSTPAHLPQLIRRSAGGMLLRSRCG